MTNPTPAAVVAALAELFCITPETHPHLWQHTVWYEPIEDDWYPMWYVMENAVKFRFTGPDPLGPDADGVWLAPAMAYCAKHCDGFIEEWISNINTAWILERLHAARVPEVCEILEGNHDTA